MSLTNLSKVERKVLGALIKNCDGNMIVNLNSNELASEIGYKKAGGIISAAIRALELLNLITVIENNKYRVLL